MSSFSIGLSALSASERALNLIGQNIANANTPGYHRQSLNLSPRVIGGRIGDGVEAQSVTRFREGLVENAITVSRFRAGRTESELGVYQQLETLLSPGPGTLNDQTQKLFGQFQELAQSPDDVTQRRVVVNTAVNLTQELNNLGGELGKMRSDLRGRIDDGLEQVNQFGTRLADYNRQIFALERTGESANELRDQRDAVLNQVADLIDVRVTEQPFGVVNVVVGSAPLVFGGSSRSLEVSGTTPTGQPIVSIQGDTASVSVTGGKVGGWLAAMNDLSTNFQPRLDAFARELATRLDGIQATGLSLLGPQTSALGARATASATAPLSGTTALPVQAGSLFLSVTDQSTGQRTLTEIPIDPATASLQDLAGALTTSSGGQIQGSVTANNRLQIQAQAGFAFDFAGRIPSSPTPVALNGTAVPSASGIYSGSGNGSYSFQVVGSGTVGTTAGLALEVRDTSNNLVGTYNVGEGYAPGTPLQVGEGIKVALTAGTTNNGTFGVPVVGQPDSTGLLAALGVNTFFSGNDATGLKVRDDLVADPSLLAASRDGNGGDASNLRRIADLRSQKVLNGGTQTLEDSLAAGIGDAGAAVRSRSDQQTALKSLQDNLLVQQQSVSGVDPNEELTNMLQFQRSYQMAAKFISTVNTTLDSLLELIR